MEGTVCVDGEGVEFCGAECCVIFVVGGGVGGGSVVAECEVRGF